MNDRKGRTWLGLIFQQVTSGVVLARGVLRHEDVPGG